MTTTIAQTPADRHTQTQPRQLQGKKLKPTNSHSDESETKSSPGCSGEMVTNEIYKSTGVYVEVLSKAMRKSPSVGLKEVSKLSEFWLQTIRLCLSCEGEPEMEAMARKVEALLVPTQQCAELLRGLIQVLLLQANILISIGQRETKSSYMDIEAEDKPPPLETSPHQARDRFYSDIPFTDREDGVDVPQIDLDELLLPTSQSLLFSHPLRQGLEHTLLKRYRARSSSDFLAQPHVDLRPTWMRSPRLYKTVIHKLQGIATPPLFYVEWNILGLRNAMERKESVRIVSPKFTPFSANPAARQIHVGPLRIMVALERVPNDNLSDNQEEHNLRMGIFFTLADDVEVSYRLFHPGFLSESRKHCFKTTPWAGLQGVATGVVKVPINEVITVGVAIESLRCGGSVIEDTYTGTENDEFLPTVSSIVGSGKSCPMEDLCSGVSISEKVYAKRSLGELISDAKLPMQQSLSRMSLSSSSITGANKSLLAHIWNDHQYRQ